MALCCYSFLQLGILAIVLLQKGLCQPLPNDQIQKACDEEEFACQNTGRCFPTRYLCDNDNDCGDNSDERDCAAKCKAARGTFLCDSSKCIPHKWHCDGDKDCLDGSDESNCNFTGTIGLDGSYEPVKFHSVHSANVELKASNTQAFRTNEYPAVVLSARPIEAGEVITISCLRSEGRWVGGVELAFTIQDPATIDETKVSDILASSIVSGGDIYKVIFLGYHQLDSTGKSIKVKFGKNGVASVMGGADESSDVTVPTGRSWWLIVNIHGSTGAVSLATRRDPDMDMKPERFHAVHSPNIELKEGKTQAYRTNSFHAIAFSDKPIKVEEEITISCLKAERRFAGGVELAFTTHNPAVIESRIPGILSSTGINDGNGIYLVVGLFSNDLGDRGDKISLKFDKHGVVSLSGAKSNRSRPTLPTSQKLWLMVNICRKTAAVSLSTATATTTASATTSVTTSATKTTLIIALPEVMRVANFHSVRSPNIELKEENTQAFRTGNFHGMVFSQQPIKVGEEVTLTCLKTDDRWVGGVEVAFTIYDPETIEQHVSAILLTSSIGRSDGIYKVIRLASSDLGDVGDNITMKFDQNGLVTSTRAKRFKEQTLPKDRNLWLVVCLFGKTAAVSLTIRYIPACGVDQFRCANTDRCLPKSYLCDNDNDCGDNSDELDCKKAARFHSVHSANVELKADSTQAFRTSSFHAIVFSDQPIKAEDVITLSCLKTELRFIGGVEVAFTTYDPATIERHLPGILTTMNLENGNGIYEVVGINSADLDDQGDSIVVKFDKNGVVTLTGTKFSNPFLPTLPTNQNLWLIVNIYGRTAAVSITTSASHQ